MIKQPIKISGGGIAGISAAINLRLAGFEVVVYERNQDIGCHHRNDWEGLENWTSDEDVLGFLKRINIKINFPNHPRFEVIGVDAELNKYEVKSKIPCFYLVKRGLAPDSLDQCLKKQAQEIGVNFEFNRSVQPQEVDIVATGHAQKSYAFAIGIEFRTDLPNMVVCILNDDIAPQAYAYLIVVNNQATLATCFVTLKKHLEVTRHYLDKAIKQFQKLLKFSIKDPKHFACSANICFLKDKSKIKIGEAGGFQDGLLGFGMRYAFLSGYLAAQAILKANDYQKASKIYWQQVKKEIYPMLKTSVVNRVIYDFFTNKTYKWYLEKTVKAPNLRKFTQKQYQPSFYKKLLFPIAKVRARKYLIR